MTALIHAFAALVIPVIALSFIVSWKEIRQISYSFT
ncbi:L-lactate permease [Actinobacillus equuli]|nr:L-lactate permease [Actinobacillus equuli]